MEFGAVERDPDGYARNLTAPDMERSKLDREAAKRLEVIHQYLREHAPWQARADGANTRAHPGCPLRAEPYVSH